MIVSALLTSVGINLALCVLFFTLYSILRKQPGNVKVYAPRLVAEGISQQSDFSLERLLPSPGWVKSAWQLSEEELLLTSGLDAVVFIRIFIFSLRVFSVAGIIGIFVLLPLNYMGSELDDISNTSLDLFSISNVNSGSKRLWVHFCAAYIITGVVCYLLYYEYKYISSKRLAYFYSSKPQPHHFTILVRGIPASTGKSLSDSIESFFTEYHSSTYLSHSIVRQTRKFRRFIEIPSAFVCFKSRYGAAIAFHIQQSINPTQWVTEQAPEPHDVYWPFFSAKFIQRWISKVVVFVATVVLIVVFLVPVVFVQGLTSLDMLEQMFPFLEGILTIAFVSQVITGYLPSLILLLFTSIVPPVMKLFSSMQGYISHSEIEKSACYKVLWFNIWNIFFAYVLSGSVINVLIDPKDIPQRLAAAVPTQASFFISYVMTSGWTGLSSELTRVIPLIGDFIGGCCSKSKDDEFTAPSISYHKQIPKILLFGLLGLTYFLLAPLILPVILGYFLIGYIVYRNQLLNVYSPKFETGGKFWPIVHNSTIFSLILMQIIAIGIFGLKKLSLASTLTVPLPVLTLLFNEYCRKCFLPIFRCYSAESLIKKDQQDHDDPAMSDFFGELVTLYHDPSVLPIQDSESIDGHNSPLLSPADV
ncbi:hyperosmolality-gated Ca2+ permeable channel 2.3-like [Tasmannia lanceolata]|uniref:hyperosmolality-gated Ca2+ permeable channel 2.3-like n=1 Tax=Tasmannia lanceolata TaxID=3420 RepID=UPI004063E5E0